MTPSSTPVSTIAQLWRYPVKSMGGENVDETTLSERGILGDRAYALLDVETGHIVSAKHSRKWAAVLTCRAEYIETPHSSTTPTPIRITLPNQRAVTSDDPDINRILSETFGRPVKLLRHAPPHPTREANRAAVDQLLTAEDIKQEPMALAAPDGTFFDHAPLHILTTTTLATLHELCPTAIFDVRRFRPNMVIEPSDNTVNFPEFDWLGHHLSVGKSTLLKLIDPTPRCVITTLAQVDLPRDLDVLRTITQHTSAISITAAPGMNLPAVVGIYATTDQTGVIRRGEKIMQLE